MEAGSSVTITSFSNAGVFYVSAAMMPIPALRALLVAAGTVVLLNWVMTMTITPAILAVWAKMFETPEGRMDVDGVIARLGEADAKAHTEAEKSYTGKVYSIVAKSPVLKWLGLVIGLSFLIGFGACISSVEFGYDNVDLAKNGAYLATGIKQMYGWVYSQHSAETLVFGTGIDYERDQRAMLDVHQALADSKWSAYGTVYGRSGSGSNTWLENMYDSDGVCPYYNLYGDGTDPWWAFYEDLHLWRKPQTFLEPRFPSTLAFGGLFAGLLDRANEWPYQQGPEDYSSTNRLIMSWDEVEMNMPLISGGTDSKLQMVKDFRAITMQSGINAYMYGWLYTQLEQFLDIDWYFWACAACSMAVVFVVSLLLGMSWFGAGLIACFAVALCVEVYGSLATLDISYQTLAASSLLMSIGIAVEFVAHPIAAFEFATGTRDERLAKAMGRTALPVVQGAFSSFLGFVMIGASDFPFLRKYFFIIFLMICLFGVINGLFFVPGLLGLVGSDKPAKENEDEHLRKNLAKHLKTGTSANTVKTVTTAGA